MNRCGWIVKVDEMCSSFVSAPSEAIFPKFVLLQRDMPLAKKGGLNFTMEPRGMIKCSRDLSKPFESKASLSKESTLIMYNALYLPRHYTQWCPSSRAAWLFLCQRAAYVWRTWIVCWRWVCICLTSIIRVAFIDLMFSSFLSFLFHGERRI